MKFNLQTRIQYNKEKKRTIRKQNNNFPHYKMILNYKIFSNIKCFSNHKIIILHQEINF